MTSAIKDFNSFCDGETPVFKFIDGSTEYVIYANGRVEKSFSEVPHDGILIFNYAARALRIAYSAGREGM